MLRSGIPACSLKRQCTTGSPVKESYAVNVKTMGRNLILAALLFISGSCKKEEVGSLASSCYPYPKLTRAQKVSEALVLVSPSGGLIGGYQLIAANGVAWSACNLPADFRKDNLKIYVSGYFLTSPELELINLSPLPFEVVSAKMR